MINRHLLFFVCTAVAWGQGIERPAELKSVQSDYARRTAEWDTQLSQQEAKHSHAIDAAKASPKDYDLQIVAIGEGIKVFRLLINRETEKIQWLEKYGGMALAQASVFESRELDIELANQTAEIRNLLEKAMADLRTNYQEAQTSGTPEAQERLARTVNRVEDLKGTLQRFEIAQTKEQDAASARAELARQLRTEASDAQARVEQYGIKISLVKATMAGEMIGLRTVVDERTTQQFLKAAPGVLGTNDPDPIFEKMVGLGTVYSKGSVLDRANRLLASDNRN